VKAAIEDEIATLRSTGKGSRNHGLNKAAYSLAQWIETGATNETWIEITLLNVAREIGLIADHGGDKVLGTIKSGIRAGKAQPREVLALYVLQIGDSSKASSRILISYC
jgi:hypothetical protein